MRVNKDLQQTLPCNHDVLSAQAIGVEMHLNAFRFSVERFGLYAVDYATQQRTLRKGSLKYKEIIMQSETHQR